MLGVMGVDIALNEIKELTPRYKVSDININLFFRLSLHLQSLIFIFLRSLEPMDTRLP